MRIGSIVAACALVGGSAVLFGGAQMAWGEPGGHGHKFKLFGGARAALDPNNLTNEVIAFDTTATTVSGAVRKINKGTTVDMLTDQVQVKYYFVNRTCAGGSPRIQLGIDEDGDGKFDANAFGYLGDKAFGGGCVSGAWTFEDMTDGAPKWDLSQLGGPMTATWSEMAAFLAAKFPNYQVVNGVLVDDSCSFAPTSCGRVLFDNVVIGNQAIDGRDDAEREDD